MHPDGVEAVYTFAVPEVPYIAVSQEEEWILYELADTYGLSTVPERPAGERRAASASTATTTMAFK